MSAGSAVHLDAGGRPRCGQEAASRLTADQDGVTCRRCLLLMAGRWTSSGLTWAEKPHGTLAAYRRHHRLGQKPCESCKQAKARDWEDRADAINEKRRAARRAA